MNALPEPAQNGPCGAARSRVIVALLLGHRPAAAVLHQPTAS
jgi:hypothetical protein